MMNKLQEYIEWARKQMKPKETPKVVEQQVQPKVETVYVDVSGKENKPKRKRKVNLNKPISND